MKRPLHRDLLARAVYKENPAFDGPNLGYFCSTCNAFERTDLVGNKVGRCDRLQGAPVKSFGVCAQWYPSDPLDWTLANGAG